MKELIIKALNRAKELLERQVPLLKGVTKSISIEDISPLDLNRFMVDNNIPASACFSVGGDFDNPCVCLEWIIDVSTTDKDKLEFKRKRFERIAWKFVYDSLIAHGYKRKGFNSGLLKDFKDTTVYDLYTNGDYDRLVGYYSLMFKLD